MKVDIAVVPWTKGKPEMAGEVACVGGELVLCCRTTQGQEDLNPFALQKISLNAQLTWITQHT